MWPRLRWNVCSRYAVIDVGNGDPKKIRKYAVTIVPATRQKSASVRPRSRRSRVDTRRPRTGTTISRYPYLQMTASANATAATINHRT